MSDVNGRSSAPDVMPGPDDSMEDNEHDVTVGPNDSMEDNDQDVTLVNEDDEWEDVPDDQDDDEPNLKIVEPDTEFENRLDKLAGKHKMSATNVKSLIHHVLTDNDVVDLMKNKLKELSGEKSPEKVPYEPKLTRSKLKEISEAQPWSLAPWPLSPAKSTQQKTVTLMDVQFSDDEDDEYDPTKSQEEEPSDDDSESVVSSTRFSDLGSPIPNSPCTPVTPITPITPTHKTSYPTITTPILKSPMGPPCNNKIKPLFKKRLHLEDSETIARRTRSKLPLVDTPLDVIESSFVAPDFTPEMYDIDDYDMDEDYVDFLQKLVKSDQCQTGTDTQDDEANDPEYNFLAEVEVADKDEMRHDKSVKVSKRELNELLDGLCELFGSDDEEDNVKSFPPYAEACPPKSPPVKPYKPLALKSTFKSPAKRNLTSSYATSSQKLNRANTVETKSFWTDDHTSGKGKDFSMDEATNHPAPQVSQQVPQVAGKVMEMETQPLPPPPPPPQILISHSKPEPMEGILSAEQREQLDDQLRKHCQLMFQFWTLADEESGQIQHREQCSEFLNELNHFKQSSHLGERSAFNIHNLDTCLNTMETFNGYPEVPSLDKWRVRQRVGKGDHRAKSLTPSQMYWFYKCPALTYAHLLPVCKLRTPSETRAGVKLRALFYQSEDALLALGLSQLPDTITQLEQYQILTEMVLPNRSASQIRCRVCYLRRQSSQHNPFTYFDKTNMLPEFDREVSHFDPYRYTCPCDYPQYELPPWCTDLELKLNRPRVPRKYQEDGIPKTPQPRVSKKPGQETVAELLKKQRCMNALLGTSGEIFNRSSAVWAPQNIIVCPAGTEKSGTKRKRSHEIVDDQGTFDTTAVVGEDEPGCSSGRPKRCRNEEVTEPHVADNDESLHHGQLSESDMTSYSVHSSVQFEDPSPIKLNETLGSIQSDSVPSRQTGIDLTTPRTSTRTSPIMASSENRSLFGRTAENSSLGSGNEQVSISQEIVSTFTGSHQPEIQSSKRATSPMPEPDSPGGDSPNYRPNSPGGESPNHEPDTPDHLPSLEARSAVVCTEIPKTPPKTSPPPVPWTPPGQPVSPTSPRHRNRDAAPSTSQHTPQRSTTPEVTSSVASNRTPSNAFSPPFMAPPAGEIVSPDSSTSPKCGSYQDDSIDTQHSLPSIQAVKAEDSIEGVVVSIGNREEQVADRTDISVQETVSSTCVRDKVKSPAQSTSTQDNARPSTSAYCDPNDVHDLDSPKKERSSVPKSLHFEAHVSPTKRAAKRILSRKKKQMKIPPLRLRSRSTPPEPQPESATSDKKIDAVEKVAETSTEKQNTETHLAELMAASTTITVAPKKRSNLTNKEKRERQRQVYNAILRPNILETDPLKEERVMACTIDYLERVRQALDSQPDKFQSIVHALANMGTVDISKLYQDICTNLKDHPQLITDFALFLTPEQAVQCGCFQDYEVFRKSKLFIRTLELYFQKMPSQLHRLRKALGADQSQEEIHESLKTLLKNQPLLLNELSQFMDNEPPPETHMEDFEEVYLLGNSSDSMTHSPTDPGTDPDSCEEVQIPEQDERYATKKCTCSCHEAPRGDREKRRTHCRKCALKVKDNRLYYIGQRRCSSQAVTVALRHDKTTGKPILPEPVESTKLSPVLAESKRRPRKKRKPKRPAATTSPGAVAESTTPPISDSEARPISDNDSMTEASDTNENPQHASPSVIFPSGGVTDSDSCHSNDGFQEIGGRHCNPGRRHATSSFEGDVGADEEEQQDGIMNEITSPTAHAQSSTPPTNVEIIHDHELDLEQNQTNTQSNIVHSLDQGPTVYDSDSHALRVSRPWAMEEDKFILESLQGVTDVSAETFHQIARQLDSRTAEAVEERFNALMELLAGDSGSDVSESSDVEGC